MPWPVHPNGLLGAQGDSDSYRIARSLRFNSADSAYLSRTPASAGNRKTWTWSGWIKRSKSGTQTIFLCDNGIDNVTFALLSINSDALSFSAYTLAWRTTSGLLRDYSAWYHIVVAFDTTQATASNRVKLYINGSEVTSFSTSNNPTQNTDYGINQAATHDVGKVYSAYGYFDGYMAEINFIDGQALTPSSFGETDAITGRWKAKAYSGTYGTNGFYLNFSDNSSNIRLGWSSDGGNHIDVVESDGTNQTIGAGIGAFRKTTISTSDFSTSSGANKYLVITPSSAIPITSSLKVYLEVDKTWSNARNLYINGSQVSTSNITTSVVSGMYEWVINYTNHGITSLTSMTLPQNTGGRTGIYGISIDGTTVVASAKDFTPNNFSVTAGAGNDSLVDSPTNYGTDTGLGGEVRGSYATNNPIDNSGGATLSNGNLDASISGLKSTRSSIAMTSGKWYCEVLVNSAGNPSIGILNSTASLSSWIGSSSGNTWGYYNDGTKNTGGTATSFGSTYTTNDIIGVAYDAGAKKIWFAKNGTWQASGNPAAGTNEAYSSITGSEIFFGGSNGGSATSCSLSFNFGQRPFAYTAPSGFKALCTQNLSQPSIQKPSKAMDVIAYTGTGASNSVSSLGFSPDLVWIKNRGAATSHAIYDTTRGTQKQLSSDTTGDEVTSSTGLTSFDSNGFTIGTGTLVNTSGTQYVAWAWDKSSQDGLDIISYTGNGANRTISHNLGVAPKMIIVKARTTAGADQGWPVWHTSIANTTYISLNSTSATASGTDYWNSASPTSSVFSLGTNAAVNANNDTYIAYAFSEIDGFSKFGSYAGNGSTDGPFIWCGFRPKMIIVKSAFGTSVGTDGYWSIIDTERGAYNILTPRLFAQTSGAEDGVGAVNFADILSNGFKIRLVGTSINNSGTSYIFIAFADSPFKYARAR